MISAMTDDDRKRLGLLLSMAKALRASMDTSLQADAANVWKFAGFRSFAQKYNDIAVGVGRILPVDAPIDVFDMEQIGGSTNTIAIVQKDRFEAIHVNVSVLIAFMEHELGVTEDEIKNLQNFLEAKLRRVMFEQPQNEVAVQNAIEQLLVGRGLQKGIDYDRETGRVKVSVKESVPDFIFPRLGLALEVKLSKEKARLSSLVEQINADIHAYTSKYALVCFLVYDIGTIRDNDEFRSGLQAEGRVSVVIVKH